MAAADAGPPPGPWDDAMARALDVARQALEPRITPGGQVDATRSNDVPIGALVLGPAGEILAAACNEREAGGDPTAHAELLALRAASAQLGRWRLDGCTLVVTLEPCTMCAGALVLARVDRLVFGAYDAKAGAVGSLWDVVRDRRLNHRPEVVGGVLARESGDLIRAFFEGRRPPTGDVSRPHRLG